MVNHEIDFLLSGFALRATTRQANIANRRTSFEAARSVVGRIN